MATWEICDKAVCVIHGRIKCTNDCIHHGGLAPKSKKPLKVVEIRPAVAYDGETMRCGCVSLHLEDGTMGVAMRFRKVVPDKHEPCADAEFLRLMGEVKAKTRQVQKV